MEGRGLSNYGRVEDITEQAPSRADRRAQAVLVVFCSWQWTHAFSGAVNPLLAEARRDVDPALSVKNQDIRRIASSLNGGCRSHSFHDRRRRESGKQKLSGKLTLKAPILGETIMRNQMEWPAAGSVDGSRPVMPLRERPGEAKTYVIGPTD